MPTPEQHPIRQVIEAHPADAGRLVVVNHCDKHGRTSTHETTRNPVIESEFWPKEGDRQTYDVTDGWCAAHMTT
jgi:hypothetical protein